MEWIFMIYVGLYQPLTTLYFRFYFIIFTIYGRLLCINMSTQKFSILGADIQFIKIQLGSLVDIFMSSFLRLEALTMFAFNHFFKTEFEETRLS